MILFALYHLNILNVLQHDEGMMYVAKEVFFLAHELVLLFPYEFLIAEVHVRERWELGIQGHEHGAPAQVSVPSGCCAARAVAHGARAG